MKELSLHILDIVENSIRANATTIEILIDESIAEDRLTISIRDNGKGMSDALLKTVRDPFTTTRTTRKVGMGISMFESAAQLAGGSLDITSEIGVGTTVTAHFEHSNIDRQPIGDIAETIAMLIMANDEVDFIYTQKINNKSFVFDTREIRNTLDGIPITEPSVIIWIKDYINKNIKEIGGNSV